MGKQLVICDTQTVAEDISRALGGRFVREPSHLEGPGRVLTWLDGPLAGLADPEVYDAALATWRIEDLPIVPERFQVVVRAELGERAKEHLKTIRALVRRPDVERLVNACAAGREGELAFAYVRELVGGADLPAERAWLSSLARAAIRDAFAQLRPTGDHRPLEDAALARAEADWLVGVNGTRAATVQARALGGRTTLGRVLTPMLAELVRRERMIQAFEPVAYDVVDAAFEPGSGSSRYRARWIQGTATGSAEVTDLHGATGKVWKIRTRGERRRPLALYDLESLQRDALRLHGMTAKRTEDAAQECFERAALSSPRSSTRYLPRELAGELRAIVNHVGKAATTYRDAAALVTSIDELPLERVIDDAQAGAQHALIPTSAAHALGALGDDARRAYDLVARRFLAAFLPPVELEHTIVLTRCERQLFYAHGHVVRRTGWYAAYDGLSPGDETGDPPEQELPELREGEEVRCARVERSERASSTPARLDDVTLLAALRGSADAAAIERLIELGYVVRDGRALRPSARGVQVIELLAEHALTSLEPVWAFEQRVRAIERGEESREACVRDAALAAGELVGYLRDLPAERTAFPRRDLGIVCPRCGEGTLIENRKGYGCSTWTSREEPGCGFVIWKTIAGRPIDEEIVRELVAKRRTRELTGFRSRAGRPFRASLVLAPADEQPVTFAFDSGARGRTRA